MTESGEKTKYYKESPIKPEIFEAIYELEQALYQKDSERIVIVEGRHDKEALMKWGIDADKIYTWEQKQFRKKRKHLFGSLMRRSKKENTMKLFFFQIVMMQVRQNITAPLKQKNNLNKVGSDLAQSMYL